MDPFASAQELEDYTSGKIRHTDPRVLPALTGVSDAIRTYCGWHVWPSITETVTLDGPGGQLLSLPTGNLTALTSVTESGILLTEGNDYRWSADGSVHKTNMWTHYFRDIEVTLTHGHQIVADLKSLVLSVVARVLSSPSGATREQAGQVSVSWALTAPGVSGSVAFLESELMIIDSYRLVSA